jgi:hypothetical protein
VELCTYCAKLTTKANFSDECNVIGNGKFQETEMRKKKKKQIDDISTSASNINYGTKDETD